MHIQCINMHMMQEQLDKQIQGLREEIFEIREELERIDSHGGIKSVQLKRVLAARIIELDAAIVLSGFYQDQEALA